MCQSRFKAKNRESKREKNVQTAVGQSASLHDLDPLRHRPERPKLGALALGRHSEHGVEHAVGEVKDRQQLRGGVVLPDDKKPALVCKVVVLVLNKLQDAGEQGEGERGSVIPGLRMRFTCARKSISPD